MPYNPTIHHRRTIRLKDYDYSQAGLYFVTICVHVGAKNLSPESMPKSMSEPTTEQPPEPTTDHGANHIRPNVFGNVDNGEMVLNDFGKIASQYPPSLHHSSRIN